MSSNVPQPTSARRTLLVLGICLLFVVGAMLVRYFDLLAPRTGTNHRAVGRQLETIRLEPLTGDAQRFDKDHLGHKATLINFWGTWCGPCQVEFPEMVNIKDDFDDAESVRVILVSCESVPQPLVELRSATRDFLQQQDASIPTYHDLARATRVSVLEAAGLDAFGYPTTVLLDKDARIVGLWRGYAEGDIDDIRAALAQAID